MSSVTQHIIFQFDFLGYLKTTCKKNVNRIKKKRLANLINENNQTERFLSNHACLTVFSKSNLREENDKKLAADRQLNRVKT
ncbi:hypothetical protein BV494_19200 [Rahnella sikkimica]|uniref:Uncharacterized protein n=1 Tax=Rahnella sikkimica TaxID=1805933 RepID=A0A2L1UVD3_9GAMM|nr:hypothetical protein BV494_19200 [Rahnella sikkimica]